MELKPALFVHITSFHTVSKLRFAPVKWCSITLEDSLLGLVVLGGRALKAKLRHCGTVPWDWRGCAEWQLLWMRGRLLAVQSSMQLPGAGDRDTRKITSHYPTGVTQYVEAIPGSAVARGACFPPCSQPAYVGVGMVGNCGNSSCPLFAFCVFAMSVAGSCRKGKQTPHRVGWVPPAGLPVLPSTVLAAFSKASLCGSDPSCTSQEQGQWHAANAVSPGSSLSGREQWQPVLLLAACCHSHQQHISSTHPFLAQGYRTFWWW